VKRIILAVILGLSISGGIVNAASMRDDQSSRTAPDGCCCNDGQWHADGKCE